MKTHQKLWDTEKAEFRRVSIALKCLYQTEASSQIEDLSFLLKKLEKE